MRSHRHSAALVTASEPGDNRYGKDHHPGLADHLPREEVKTAESQEKEYNAVNKEPNGAAYYNSQDEAAP